MLQKNKTHQIIQHQTHDMVKTKQKHNQEAWADIAIRKPGRRPGLANDTKLMIYDFLKQFHLKFGSLALSAQASENF
jgi:hypothetical protein